MSRNDRRFVKGKDILSQLEYSVNITEMEWEDFEFLIRKLFEKIFSDDSSVVKDTQASRDGGVDEVIKGS